MSEWRPISEHVFPWKPDRLLIACYASDFPEEIEVFLVTCADHGRYYPDGSMLALDEMGFVPYSWNPDIPPLPVLAQQSVHT